MGRDKLRERRVLLSAHDAIIHADEEDGAGEIAQRQWIEIPEGDDPNRRLLCFGGSSGYGSNFVSIQQQYCHPERQLSSG